MLKDADLVVESIAGTRRIYRVNQRGLIALREYLDRFWVQTLVNFKETVESREGEES